MERGYDDAPNKWVGNDDGGRIQGASKDCDEYVS